MSAYALVRLELARIARRRRTYWFRTAYVAILAAAIALAWLAEVQSGASWTEQAAAGTRLFVFFGWFQFGIITLMAVAGLAGSITEERHARTLPVLQTTRLGALAIVQGKLIGGVIPILYLLLSGLPVLCVLLAFGGLAPSVVAWVFGLTLIWVLLCAAVALFFSCLSRSEHSAFFAAILVLGVFMALGLTEPQTMIRPWSIWSPVRGFHVVLTRSVTDWTILALPVLIGISGILGLIFMSAVALLNRDDPSDGAGGSWMQRVILGRQPKRAGRLAEPLRGNPVFLFEVRDPRQVLWFVRGPMLRLGILALLGMVVLDVSFTHRVGAGLSHARILPILMAVLLIGALVRGVRLFCEEKERDAFTVLLTTPLSSRTILWGKLMAGLWSQIPFAGWLLVYVVLFWATGALPGRAAILVPGIWLGGIVFGMVLGLLAGLLADRTRRALLVTTGLWIGLDCLLVPLFRVTWIAGTPGNVFYAFLPYWMLAGWRKLLGSEVAPTGYILYAGTNVAIHLLAAAGLFYLARRYFNRLAGRVG